MPDGVPGSGIPRVRPRSRPPRATPAAESRRPRCPCPPSHGHHFTQLLISARFCGTKRPRLRAVPVPYCAGGRAGEQDRAFPRDKEASKLTFVDTGINTAATFILKSSRLLSGTEVCVGGGAAPAIPRLLLTFREDKSALLLLSQNTQTPQVNGSRV